ncbi:rCG63235 [Rattus norvegicus]|uniref:RCG63235 n=1 Tax=Rattus norvegicus TaxID=10116 RepID=A6JTK2_RAT|nr:rCG63235 [Rattus norvegicus]
MPSKWPSVVTLICTPAAHQALSTHPKDSWERGKGDASKGCTGLSCHLVVKDRIAPAYRFPLERSKAGLLKLFLRCEVLRFLDEHGSRCPVKTVLAFAADVCSSSPRLSLKPIRGAGDLAQW